MFITYKKGHASTPYSRTGIHLERSKLVTTSSGANLITLLKIELNEVKNNLFAVSNEHSSQLSTSDKKIRKY